MTANRRAAIVRLLETRDQHLPEQRRRDIGARPGFTHDTLARETCEDCLANGRVLKTCEACHGRGYIERHRARDPYAETLVQPYGIDASRHDRGYALESSISAAKQQLRRFPGFRPVGVADELADANANPYGWEIARRRMYASFDYGALDAALERLRDVDRGAYHALHEVWVYGWMPVVSAGLEAALEVGLAFLDERLPVPVRAPGISTTEVAA